MHTLALTLLFALTTAGLTPTKLAMINAILDDFHKAASEADEARYFGHMAPDAIFIGTDATERWDMKTFRGYAHPHFAAGKGWTYTPRNRNVVIRGDVAWFDELLDNAKYGTCRGTGVLVRRGGKWRIAQYSLSIPIPNEVALDVVKVIRTATSP